MKKEMSLKKATFYNLISKFGTMGIQLGLTMVLSRLVSTSEHGVISLVIIILTFLALFADLGLGVSVIQHPEMDKDDINKLFSFSFVIGLALMAIMCLLAFPVSVIYKNKIYLILCPIASITALFSSINIVPNAVLVRDKRFDLIAIRSLLSAIVPGSIAVYFAYKGFGVYSLLIQSVSSAFLLFLWNYIKSPMKLCKFRFKSVFALLGRYSLFQFLFNILNYFTRNTDNLIIGAHFNETELGYYNKAYTLNLYPNTILTSVVSGALHPYVREYKNDFAPLYLKLIKLLKVLSWAGLYIGIICFWCSKEIVLILFGNNWAIAGEYFKWLSLCIWAQVLSSVAGSVFLGIEKTNRVFLCGVINLILLICAILVGIFFESVLVISIGVSIVYNIVFFITYYILIKKSMGYSFIGFIKSFIVDYITYLTISFLSFLLPPVSDSIWISLLLKTGLCTVLYLFFMLCSGQLFKVKTTIKEAFK